MNATIYPTILTGLGIRMFKVIDSQFEVVNVKFQKLEGDVAEVRQEVQEIERVIFKPAA